MKDDFLDCLEAGPERVDAAVRELDAAEICSILKCDPSLLKRVQGQELGATVENSRLKKEN